MNINIPNQIREFFAATTNPYSYNFLKNIYIWFGIFWGLPIPFITLFYEVQYLVSTGVQNPLYHALISPFQWFFIAHPLLFAILFGILGSIRFEMDQELANKIEQLDTMSQHDALTGLKNRRYFSMIFQGEVERSHRRQESLALLFIDIDNFKQINDNYGHFIGDKVLKELGAYLVKHCRPYDTPVRWGGEEFIILLRATDENAALTYAERIRKEVKSGLSDTLSLPFTLSIGLTQYQENDTLETFTDRADKALYHAKQTGKNKVVRWTSYQQLNKEIQ